MVLDLGQAPQHLPDVAGPCDGGAIGQLEDEIAKAEVLEDVLPQVLEEVWRFLAHELRTDLDRPFPVLPLHRLDEDREVFVVLADPLGEFQPRFLVELAVTRKADVGDDAEDLAGKSFVELPRLFVVLGKQDLWSGPDPQEPVREVDPLRHQSPGLAGDLGVEVGEIDGVETGFVLDQDDGLDTTDQDVVLGVSTVLDLFDHRQQALDVALPEESPIELTTASQVLEPRKLPGMSRDQPHRKLGVFLFDLVNQLADLHVRQARCRDDHVEVAFFDQAQRLGGLRRAGESRCKPEVEIKVAILLDHQLGELAVFLENE